MVLCAFHLQDGQAIKASERIAAAQALTHLEQQLHSELTAGGVDITAAAAAEDDADTDEQQEVAETGYVDEQGELRRPWCPATRILEHREMVRARFRTASTVWPLFRSACCAGCE